MSRLFFRRIRLFARKNGVHKHKPDTGDNPDIGNIENIPVENVIDVKTEEIRHRAEFHPVIDVADRPADDKPSATAI